MHDYNHERIHQVLDYQRPWHLYRPASGQPKPKTGLAEAALNHENNLWKVDHRKPRLRQGEHFATTLNEAVKKSIGIILALLPLHLLAGVQAAETATLQASASERVSARPELVITTLGFGSCARQERPQPIWDAINAARCDAFVLCGDNIYADSSEPAVFREKYALLAAMPGFAYPPCS